MNNKSPHLESLLEYTKFFELLDLQQLQSLLPEQFQAYAETIYQVKGSPFYGLIGAMVDCGSGLFLFALGGILSKSFTSLSPLERYVLAASPMITGGFLRIWATNQSDKGQGKQAILKLLAASLLGVIGHMIMLSMAIDLSTINSSHAFYYIFLINNILTGVGIATYSAGMALGAQAAPQDNPEAFFKHLENSSEKIGHQLHANCLETSFSSILRNRPSQYLALIACVSNFSPGMTLITASFLIPKIGLRNTYIFFAGMTSIGILTTWFCVENSIFDQLKKINPDINASVAKEIARFMGQHIFPSNEPFFERLTQLDKTQKKEVIKATIDYTLTFGLLTALTSIGPIILQNKGTSLSQAILTIATVSMLSSLMRGLMTVVPPIIKTDKWMLISQSVMLTCSVVLLYTDDLSLIQTNMLIFGLFNGIGNFCVVDRVSQKIPQDIGLATGISSGIAAFLAFPISIMLTQEEKCFTAISALGLAYHIYQNIIEYCDSKSYARVHVLEMSSP